MRTATIERETKETKVALSIDLDGAGTAHVDTGVPFLDHMLDLFAYHGCFDLDVACQGDVEVDGHHSTEDVGIALGRAISEALGDRRGIFRYGDIALPMAVISATAVSTCRPSASVPSKPSSPMNSWRRSRASWAHRCMCANWRDATATISSRRRSKASDAPCARRFR